MARRIDQELVRPLQGHFYHLPDDVVAPPAWVVIFTRAGENFSQVNQQSGNTEQYYFLGEKKTLFHDPQVVPVVIRLEHILIGAQIRETQASMKRIGSGA
ncbi:MAG TPA: hypothetical protein VMP11_12270 [Verrucomicrobiae bacterium]|nr:hypothetical protein [Verrucomicrobiae bacterium]